MVDGPACGLPASRYARLRERCSRSVLANVWRGGMELELVRRSMAFATLGLVALAPLLVVVAAVNPTQQGLGQWIVDGMGLPPDTAAPVLRLFAPHHQTTGQFGALGLALLAAFGIAFATDVQLGYQRIWDLPPESWRQLWRRAVWLAAMIGYLVFEVESGVLLRHGPLESAVRIVVFATAGLFFFWWGQYFLLAGRVPWGWLLPGAIATVLGLSGLRAFSVFVFKPMIDSSAKDYGTVGVVLVILSWLIGVGFVIFGGALAGRYYCERQAQVRTAREHLFPEVQIGQDPFLEDPLLEDRFLEDRFLEDTVPEDRIPEDRIMGE